MKSNFTCQVGKIGYSSLWGFSIVVYALISLHSLMGYKYLTIWVITELIDCLIKLKINYQGWGGIYETNLYLKSLYKVYCVTNTELNCLILIKN